MKERNFVMAGGGTGGHVIPALAVARELRTRGHNVSFVGTEHGIEAKLVPAAGFRLQNIQIGGLNRVGMRQTIVTLGRLPIATVSCDRCVRGAAAVFSRSEEHTSELQSLRHLVCRLLLEKKKKKINRHIIKCKKYRTQCEIAGMRRR